MSARNPPYVESASYSPCPACSEGSLTWDVTRETTCCVACGEVSE